MLLEDFIDYDGKKIMFITGSGISEASGVPTFRGTNGLWLNNDIEEICNIRNFNKFYDKIIPFYDGLRLSLADKKYNIAQFTKEAILVFCSIFFHNKVLIFY